MAPFNITHLLNAIPLHIYWKDKNGIYLGCNLAQARSYGYENPSEIVGKTDFELAPSEDLARSWVANDKKVLESRHPVIVEEVGLMNGRQVIGLSYKSPFTDEAGNIVGIVGASIDLTNEKNIQKKLVDEKNKTQMTLDNIIARLPGHVYWMDNDNHYLGCNDSHAKTAGLSSRLDVVGKTNLDLAWADQNEILNAINNKIRMTKKEYSEEEVALTSTGETRTFLSRKVPMLDEENKVLGILGISFDITDRKKMEQELLAAKEAAEAANRAKTDFLANMSHDMKTPLSGIVTTAEVIAYDEGAREIDRQFASMISASGKQLSSFFTGCLDLSKLEMEEWVSAKSIFSVRQLLNDIHDLYLPKAIGGGLSISVIANPNLPEAVEGHHDSLYRALLNLAGNALKFTEKGGITLRASCGEQIDAEHVTILFQVEDTGMGIPEDKFKVIFEKLQRLTPSYSSKIEGSGIGLYIVDQFIKRMGGSIQVESEVGKGSTFSVSVPLRIAHATLPDKPTVSLKSHIAIPAITMSEPSTAVNHDSPRVLLVEDVLIIQIATKSLLNGTGFYVDIASSGQEALALCASKDYGVIYMDIGLPDMEGYEAAALIRQHEKAFEKQPTPIIALTGHGAMDVQRFCANAGIQGVLSKPLIREQAELIWQRYVKHEAVVVPNLTVLEGV